MGLQNQNRWSSIVGKPGIEWTDEDKDYVWGHVEKNYLDQFVKKAYRYLRIGVEDKDNALEFAKDVVKDTSARMFRRSTLGTYDPGRYQGLKDPFINWLYVAICRYAVGISRREHGRAVRNMIRAGQEAERNRAEQLKAQDEPEWEWSDIETYVQRLSPLYREAMELVVHQELSHRQAANASTKPCEEGAMKVRLCRAKQELKRAIPPKEESEAFVEQLATPLRQAYILCVVNGFSAQEAARRAECTEQEMENRLGDIRRLLAESRQTREVI